MTLQPEKHLDILHRGPTVNTVDEVRDSVILGLGIKSESGKQKFFYELLFTSQDISFKHILSILYEEYVYYHGPIGLKKLSEDLESLLAQIRAGKVGETAFKDRVELFILSLNDYLALQVETVGLIRAASKGAAHQIEESIVYSNEVQRVSRNIQKKWDQHLDQSNQELKPEAFNTLSALEKLGFLSGWRNIANEVYQRVFEYLSEEIQLLIAVKSDRVTNVKHIAKFIETVAKNTAFEHQQVVLRSLERQHALILKELSESAKKPDLKEADPHS